MSSNQTQRIDFYSTKQVLEKTLMSRYTLLRKTRRGEFPGPSHFVSDDNSEVRYNMYPADQVDDWISQNQNFIAERSPQSTRIIANFPHLEMLRINKASKLLECGVDFFVEDAAIYKARRILDFDERHYSSNYP